jgi:hypothetical protein
MFNIFCVCVEPSINETLDDYTNVETTIHTGHYKFLEVPRIGETVTLPKFDFDFKVRAVKHTIEMISNPLASMSGNITTSNITIHLTR